MQVTISVAGALVFSAWDDRARLLPVGYIGAVSVGVAAGSFKRPARRTDRYLIIPWPDLELMIGCFSHLSQFILSLIVALWALLCICMRFSLQPVPARVPRLSRWKSSLAVVTSESWQQLRFMCLAHFICFVLDSRVLGSRMAHGFGRVLRHPREDGCFKTRSRRSATLIWEEWGCLLYELLCSQSLRWRASQDLG